MIAEFGVKLLFTILIGLGGNEASMAGYLPEAQEYKPAGIVCEMWPRNEDIPKCEGGRPSYTYDEIKEKFDELKDKI